MSTAAALVTPKPQVQFKRATPSDVLAIIELYHRIYGGTYTDPLMSHPSLLSAALSGEEYHWMLAVASGQLVGSVVYRYDPVNRLGKAFGAVVDPDFRGDKMTERLMQHGYDQLRAAKVPIEVVYATTRTVSAAPQKLTQNLGYKKLGIFPNVHRTSWFETHCLAARFEPEALKDRFTAFALHPKLAPLYEIVREECDLPPLQIGPPGRSAIRPRSTLPLEVLQAPMFVKHRFGRERTESSVGGQDWFYPFHEPNILFTSADQSTEVFAYLSPSDKYCTLIGFRDTAGARWADILESVTKEAHDLGARYLECLIRADETVKIDMAIQAGFIPSAYFPAMNRLGAHRYDYVVFSRSFEILDFRNIRLEGVNQKLLVQYFKLWKSEALGFQVDPEEDLPKDESA